MDVGANEKTPCRSYEQNEFARGGGVAKSSRKEENGVRGIAKSAELTSGINELAIGGMTGVVMPNCHDNPRHCHALMKSSPFVTCLLKGLAMQSPQVVDATLDLLSD